MRETRTESDLAEALAALERYAPDPDTVRRELRGHPRRPAIRWRRPLIVAAIASAAAAALVLALLVPAGALEAGPDRPGRDPAVDHAERDALLAEVSRLPRRQKAVLVLRYYEALSDAEIAEVLGCTPGTVRGYASRALATLRVDLSRTPSGAVRKET